jgi:hypothetical protein
MKLPRRRAKPAPRTEEPASAAPAAPVLQLVIFSNTELPEQDFDAQRDKLRRVASYDSTARSWHNQVPLDRPEWAAEMLSVLFVAARVHGTTILVQALPAGEGSPR